MAIQGMIQAVRFNASQLGKRMKMHERSFATTNKTSKGFKGKREMTSHEFAEFQKDLYTKKRKEKKKMRVVYLITIVISIVVLYLLVSIFYAIIYSDYSFVPSS